MNGKEVKETTAISTKEKNHLLCSMASWKFRRKLKCKWEWGNGNNYKRSEMKLRWF